jgi:hypothetical protein
MITVTTKLLEEYSFNLSSFDSERSLIKAWDKIKVDTGKKIKLTTKSGKRIELKTSEVEKLIFDECLYVSGTFLNNVKDYFSKKKKSEEFFTDDNEYGNRSGFSYNPNNNRASKSYW